MMKTRFYDGLEESWDEKVGERGSGEALDIRCAVAPQPTAY